VAQASIIITSGLLVTRALSKDELTLNWIRGFLFENT